MDSKQIKHKHTLVRPDDIKACGIEFDNSNKIVLTVLPICGIIYEGVKEDSLNHKSYMASYVWTVLQLQDKHSSMDSFQKLLVDLGYEISYQKPILLSELRDCVAVPKRLPNVLQYIKDKDLLREYLNKIWIIER